MAVVVGRKNKRRRVVETRKVSEAIETVYLGAGDHGSHQFQWSSDKR
ncbi:MAG: hypothetical protein ACPGT1_02360 [Ilumatobacteraceae bacterium]